MIHLRICLQHYIIDVGDQAWEDESNKEDGHPRSLSLVALGAAVEAEVLEGDQSENTDLLKLKVAIWVDHLIFFVVQKGKRDNSPKDLEISLKLYQNL